MIPPSLRGRAWPFALLFTSLASPALAQDQADTAPVALPPVEVSTPVSSTLKFDPPQTIQSISGDQIDQTVNAVSTTDTLKYLPSLFVRQRNYGDTQGVLATRTWGLNSSARSLVYVDDVPISALIANDNTKGAPRWGLVSPDDIANIDVLYGPYSAAFPGNSMGAVVQIDTKLPTSPFEASGKQTEAFQGFDLYGTHDTYRTDQSEAHTSGHYARLSWSLDATYQNSWAQPLQFVTNPTVPAGTLGTFLGVNKTGAPADVVGAGQILHTQQNNLNLKLTADLTDTLRLSYQFGYFHNDGNAHVETYLTDTVGNPTFANVAGFASNTYSLEEAHSAHALSLKSDTHGNWDWEVVGTHYQYDTDDQLNPLSVTSTGTGFSTNGRNLSYSGTNWTTLDGRLIWRPTGPSGAHEVSVGIHGDQYVLNNPTYNVANWRSDQSAVTGLFSEGKGQTRTGALWAQDLWRFAPDWRATVGGRLENWQASNGFNFSGTTGVSQPKISSTDFSPKASLSWDAMRDLTVTASFGQAYRYPTVAELYQLVQTGAIFSSPNPNLSPENVLSGELAFQKQIDKGSVRVSFFQENVRDALISQTSFLTGATPVTFVSNVGEVRNRGIEIAGQRDDIIIPGFGLSGSVTYVDSDILSDAGFVSTTGTTATGKRAPNVPEWRATLVATYKPTDDLSFSVGSRYSSRAFSTVDNSDVANNVFGGFGQFFVVDVRAQYKIKKGVEASLGIDNLTNDKYFLFHPFPQRTVLASLKLAL